MNNVAKLIDPLSKEQEEEILKEIDYSREQLSADLKLIREWLSTQHHLPPSVFKESDTFFELYLTSCKGRLATVKRKLDNYYTFRNKSKFCANRDPTDASYLAGVESWNVTVIPQVGFDGTRLCIGKYVDVKPGDFNVINFGRIVLNTVEMNMRTGHLNTSNYLMFDLKECPPSAILKINPFVVKDLIYLLQEVIPFRFKRLAAINTPPYMEVIINTLIKPFLSKKLQQRLHVTSGDHADLLNYFSPSQLPRDYGGLSSNPSLKEYTDIWTKTAIENKHFFVNELSEKTDESKRIIIETTPNDDSFFGMEGSLKKLVID